MLSVKRLFNKHDKASMSREGRVCSQPNGVLHSNLLSRNTKIQFEISVMIPRGTSKMPLMQTHGELDSPGDDSSRATQLCALKGEPCPVYLLICYMLYGNCIDTSQGKQHITPNHAPWLLSGGRRKTTRRLVFTFLYCFMF